MDYTIFYKRKLDGFDLISGKEELNYDYLISAYNESFRVTKIFDLIQANTKQWLILPEYNFTEIELMDLAPNQVYNYSKDLEEDEIILDFFQKNRNNFLKDNIAIDITGFLRPHLVFIIKLLKLHNIKKVDFIYSEPNIYKERENTRFSSEYQNIREIKGCANSHSSKTTNDFLVFGSGYDHFMISKMSKFKADTKKVQILGFPSLQPDMFQENVLKAYLAEENSSSNSFNIESSDVILSPANDPFITAKLLSDYIRKEENKRAITNLYLCPLSTKAHTLGMALYYISECNEKPVSFIFPFSASYSRETSEGLSKVWIYTVEF